MPRGESSSSQWVRRSQGSGHRAADIMVVPRAKRVRVDMAESFWEEETQGQGIFLTVTLKSGAPVKERGWPWVQNAIRGILGGHERVEKASFNRDGGLLLKTKDDRQTNALLQATSLGGVECEVQRERTD